MRDAPQRCAAVPYDGPAAPAAHRCALARRRRPRAGRAALQAGPCALRRCRSDRTRTTPARRAKARGSARAQRAAAKARAARQAQRATRAAQAAVAERGGAQPPALRAPPRRPRVRPSTPAHGAESRGSCLAAGRTYATSPPPANTAVSGQSKRAASRDCARARRRDAHLLAAGHRGGRGSAPRGAGASALWHSAGGADPMRARRAQR